MRLRKVSRNHPSRPRAPPANAASSPNVCFRTRPRRLHRHPRPSRSARRVQKRTHQFSLQVFRLKSESPPFSPFLGHTLCKRRRVKIHAPPPSSANVLSFPRARKPTTTKLKKRRRKTRGRTLVVLIIIANEDVISSRMRLQFTAFLLFLLPLFEENGVLSP